MKEGKLDTRRANIWAMRSLAEIFKPTYGPNGSYKVLMNSTGQYLVTKDGAAILKELDIGYPGLRMIARISKVMEDEIGDGTKLAVILTGALLEKAETLLKQGLHPTVIIDGYRLAADEGIRAINALAREVDAEPFLKLIIRTAMTGRLMGGWSDHLVYTAVEAVKHLVRGSNEKNDFDPGDIMLIKKPGGGVNDTYMITGIVIEKEKAHPAMPHKVMKARVALLGRPLEMGFKRSKYKKRITINRIDERRGYLEGEEAGRKGMISKIAGAGVSVVFCNKDIEDAVKYGLAEKGILAVERTKKVDMEKLARSTSARILEDLNEIGSEDLGYAGVVEETEICGSRIILVHECENPKALSIVIRGGNQSVVDEVERSLKDGFGVIRSFLKDRRTVAGGGAVEMELSRILQKFAEAFDEKKQLAIKAFGEAMIEVPRLIAKNSGRDPLDVLTALWKKHEEGCTECGVDVNRGGAVDMFRRGVVEPAQLKIQALKSASEVANAILRIDAVVSSRGADKTKGFVAEENEVDGA